ncbi:dephospho-CoA kinase [Amylibacter marinus]|uniref:Dephospho-CoA kinase n=1 Tax=Amylibacter marinus TaxID=1475483 RepID=A0ABQ5VWU8_9RHOB|nr:dephospho-CoA kinase [Amylibacter marinus]GLQ35531.1 dephospho-CoA kinase [Amylibacter marinus]
MSKVFLLGLTGSIGMGKSTTAEMFRDAEIAVWDADAAVHELYTTDTETIEKIHDIAPIAVTADGVDRQALSRCLQADKELFPKLETIVHEAIRTHRAAFIEACQTTGQKMAVLDIPLLFETGAQDWLDAVLVVSVDADVQKARVMERPGMTEDVFAMILSRQTPDGEKRARADYVIETHDLDGARASVQNVIESILKSKDGAQPDA